MGIDPNERTYSEIVDAYVARFSRAETPFRMAHDLIVAEEALTAAEREIDRLVAKISAGYIRRDVSAHYTPGWSPKPPVAAVTDDWIETGRGDD